MAEVIGVVASVGQLLQYSCTLIETLRAFYERVRDAPERHDRQLHHITQIISTATLIRETKSLQNELVSTHLNSITITIKSLEHTIKKAIQASPTTKTRYWKALWSSNKDNSISKGFALLEEHKSALALCLLGTLGAVLVPAVHSTVDIVEQIRVAIQQLPRVQTCMDSSNDADHSSLESGNDRSTPSRRRERSVAQQPASAI
ncbi:hypothetical protein K505DRAFT_358577 [Melanomma pulvis-pyrius CBS 109.77]|uniref:Fungal N-terminal domain-containing protein n=1 Tax=Melanomma pulvis-pyrius CBS 109.77 TaxID=1314802 RepID=A0A6A6XMQ1_9PLEO|nr:hypothetical protein K505DRAFT_358577 [Melanomma pulvis-pyrius CBS 109.77]